MVRIVTDKRPPSGRRQDIRVNDVFTAEVADLVSDGRAVLQHPRGLRFFVAGAWPGERVKLRITDLKQHYGSAELLEVRSAAPERISPACPHHGTGKHSCGGCGWMFVSYPAQLRAKQRRVEKALASLTAPDAVQPILPSERQLGYRTRAQLKTDGKQLGFVQPASRNLANIEQCLVLTQPNQQTLQALRQQLPRADWRPSGGKPWTTLDIDEQTDADAASVNQRRPFHQANAGQNQKMRHWLQTQLLNTPRQSPVLELFAGAGNFTRVLAETGFTQITAVEVVDAALEELRQLQLPGVALEACDLFNEAAVQALVAAQQDAELLVLDPPRDGLKVRAPFVAGLRHLQKVLYVSCDLATFRRDAQAWTDAGYQLTEVQPLDLFPQTPHVELLAVFERGRR